MQYPPQQPFYPPSEIYIPEQSQAFAPQPPMVIAVYVNRGQVIWRTVLCAIALLFVILDLAFLVGLMAPDTPSGWPILVPFFALMMVVVVFAGWVSWSLFSMLLVRGPMLSINREGIVISRMPTLKGFSISWNEIEAIFTSRSMFYKYLCIAPKNPDHYLKTHFNAFGRFYRRANAWLIGSPLYFPQVLLDKRLEEVLSQVAYVYANELNYYRVQIRY